MSTTFLNSNVWPRITKSLRASKQRCAVAVAYFGAGASRLLPLPKGSRLVVDASERAVTSGQTSPADLLKLMKRGVALYSVPNLHAKVFVLGRAAYVGSTNVSNHSAKQLIEAAIHTTEPTAVRAAREFVEEHCLHELTPKLLKQLAKLYRPPQIPGGKRRKKKEDSHHPALPRLLLAQLERQDWSEQDQHLHDQGLAAAKKRRQHPRGFQLEAFQWPGNCPYIRGDKVIQVTDEGNGSVMVEPPGNVLHVVSRGVGKARNSIVYTEQPVRRRREVKVLARVLGCSERLLRKRGVVRTQSFARALLKTLGR